MSPALFLAATHAVRPGSKSLLIGLLAALAAGALFAAISTASAMASNTRDFLARNYSGDIVVASGQSAALFGSMSITGNERQALLPSSERIEELCRETAEPEALRRLLVGYLSIVPADLAEEEMAIAYGLGPEGLGFVRAGIDDGKAAFPFALAEGSALPGPGEILLSGSFARRLSASAGTAIGPGSLLTATALKDAGLGVRSLRVSGLYRYDGGVSELDRIVFLEAGTASRLLLDEADITATFTGGGPTRDAVPGPDAAPATTSVPAASLASPDDELFASTGIVSEAADPGAAGAMAAIAATSPAGRPGAGSGEETERLNRNWHYLCQKLGQGRDVRGTIRNLDAAFEKEGIRARAFAWDEASSGYAASAGLFRTVSLSAIGLAALFAVLVLANSLAILAASRTRTIGTIRAMGADRGLVFRWMALEGLLAAAIGAAAGAGLTAALIAIIDAAGLAVNNPAVREVFASNVLALPVHPVDIAVAAAAAVIAASPACIAAAARALRIDPAVAMKA